MSHCRGTLCPSIEVQTNYFQLFLRALYQYSVKLGIQKLTTEHKAPKYQITNMETGEIVTPEEFVREYFANTDTSSSIGFQISYPSALLRFLSAASGSEVKILGYLLQCKNNQNIIGETSRSVAEALGVSKNTVNKVLQKLQTNGTLVKLKQGTYMLDPNVMIYGGGNGWRARDLWNKSKF